MKRFLLIAIAMSCATSLLFAGIDKVVAKVTGAESLAAVSNVKTTSKVTGYINRIDITVANAISMDSVVVSSSNALTGVVTTLKTATDVSATASYMLTNYVQRICLLDEPIYLTVTNSAVTNQSVMATVIYERP